MPELDTTFGPAIAAVLFDRDGTLVVDVPHNADPARVVAMPGAREAVALVRSVGLATGVVTNQSVVGRGDATLAQVEATNRRVDELVGPVGEFYVCPHAPGDGCDCRKPAPGLLHEAAAALGVSATQLAVIGDKGSDMRAATSVGATAILVPSHDTASADSQTAEYVVATVLDAAELIVRLVSAREQ